jgi:ATP-dependent exoDNAse (exonuclease V) beta subunit
LALNPKISYDVKLQQLRHISPSQFSALKRCPLRVIFSSTPIPRYLPSSPSARLGTVVHKIVEIAGAHQFDEGAVEDLWHSKVQEQEQQMKQSWFDRHLIPLDKTAPDYEVKKRQCFLILGSLKSTLTTVPGIASVQTLKEQSLKSKDGLIVGRADEIRTEQDGTVTIVDYKTGKIHGDQQDTKIGPR